MLRGFNLSTVTNLRVPAYCC